MQQTPATGFSDPQNKSRKFHNVPTDRETQTGRRLHFASQKEARRFDQLLQMEQAGEIKDLRLQVDFTLQEAYTDAQGRRTRAIRYVADFTYLKPKGGASGASRVSWELVVEDVKARPTKTKSYTIKKKLMKDKFGTDITEV